MKKYLLAGFLLLLIACARQPISDGSPSASSSSSSSFSFSFSSSSEPTVLEQLNAHAIPDLTKEPITFTLTAVPVRVKIAKETRPASAAIADLLDADARGVRCGTPFTAAERDRLAKAFAAERETIYMIFDPSASLDPALYTISILPNAMKFDSEKAIKDMFDICAVGTEPLRLWDSRWLVFGNSACGGASPNGDKCDAVRGPLEATLRFR